MSSKRTFYLEDGDRSDLTGTFYPIAHAKFDTLFDEFIVRDDLESPADSLRSLRISLEQVHITAGPCFPQFDEVRSWTPINTKQPLMDHYYAFGPTEDCAILTRVSPEDRIVETLDAKLWINSEAEFKEIVELFDRISACWELLFETVDHQFVTGRTDSLTEDLDKIVVRM